MRYYCHNCRTPINADELLPEFTCPTCHSGFVEEIPDSSRRNSGADNDTIGPGSDDGAHGFFSGRVSSDEYSDDNSDVEFLEAPLAQVLNLFQSLHQQPNNNTPANNNNTNNNNNAGQSSTQSDSGPEANSDPQTQRIRMITRTANRATGRAEPRSTPLNTSYIADNAQSQTLADVLQEFISGVSFGTHYPEGNPSNSQQGSQGASGTGGPIPASRGLINIDFPIPYFLHSNPGDYAWGNAGFDAVITQLLNNLDGSNSGPPPMPKDQINSLPTVKISDEQVKGGSLQCTVCMDEFQAGDSARQLPCEHFFHQDCILPWLNIHASCPICRKTFVAGPNTNQNDVT